MERPITASDTTLSKLYGYLCQYNKNNIIRSGPLPHPTQHSHSCGVTYTTKITLYGAAHITASDTTLPYLCDYIFKKNRIYNLQTFNRQLLMFSCSVTFLDLFLHFRVICPIYMKREILHAHMPIYAKREILHG